METVIKCGKLYTAENDDVQNDMALVIDDKVIKEICPWNRYDFSERNVIDLSQKFVMPGLIDAHLHTDSDGTTGGNFLSKTIGDFTIQGMLHAQADLKAGFTTLRNVGCEGYNDIAIRDAINRGDIWGPRMICSGPAIGATGGPTDFPHKPGVEGGYMGIVCDGPDEMRKAAREVLKHGADMLKFMATAGINSKSLDPGAQKLTYEEMRAAIEIAEMAGATSAAHAHGTEGIKAAVKAGITSIEHGSYMDDETIELMVKKGTYFVPTFVPCFHILEHDGDGTIADYIITKAKNAISHHRENYQKCLKAGVKIGFGTDTGTPYNFHGKQKKEFELMVNAGMSARQALASATRVNASLLKMEDKVGKLAAGMFADITAYDGDPMQDIRDIYKLSFVMKDGVVYRDTPEY